MSLMSWDELITPASPAAGVAFIRLVPGITWEQALTVEATFTTSAAAASRIPFVAYANGDSVEYYRSPIGAGVPASSVVTVTWSPEFDTNAVGGASFDSAPLRDEKLPSGYHLVIGMGAIDVADQISSVRIYARRHPTGPMEPAFGAKPFELAW